MTNAANSKERPMKKAILGACLLFMAAATTFGQNIGDKIYKENINGSNISRWMEVLSIDEYDSNGNEIHYKTSFDYEEWWEYTYWDNGRIKTIIRYGSI